MSYVYAQTNDDRPDAPQFATVEQALMAAAKQQDDDPTCGVLAIYDRWTGDVICLVWQGRIYWP